MKRLARFCAAVLCLISVHAVAAPAPETSQFVVVKYRNKAELQAAASQFQHLIVDAKKREFRTEASNADVAALREAGFDVRVDPILNEKLQAFETALRLAGSQKSIPGYTCYRTVEETYTTMNNLVASKPTLANIVDIGPSFEKSRNASLGYTMKVLRITNSATDATLPNKPNMVIFGSIHAREYTPAELVTRFGEWLVNGYGTDSEATWLVDNYRFHLVLQANPDGRKKAEAGSSWRKNTNNTNGSCSSSSFGTDLNRNFGFHWSTVPGGSSGDPCNETYRGPTAASEQETRNLIQYVAGTKGTDGSYTGGVFPDRRADTVSAAAPSDFQGIFMDIHSYSQLVLWPWGDTSSASPNSVPLRTLGRRLAWFNNYTPQQSAQLYATDGATDDNFYGSLGVPSYTIELGVAFFESCTTFQNTTLPKNLSALKYAARNLSSPYNTPAGPDTVSVSASAATVSPGASLTISAAVNDSRFNQTNGTETIQNIASAIVTIDKLPGSVGATPITMSASDGTFNANTETVTATISTTGLAVGRHLAYVQATDTSGKAGTPNAVIFNIVSGTNAAPVANFSLVTSGLTATFSDSSSDADGSIAARAWNFGDGSTSTATNPSKTYSAAGTYNVQLTVTDNGGLTNTVTKSVTVTTSANVAPVANFSVSTSGLTATFTDTSTDSDGTLATRAWNFGDSTTSTATNPSKTYSAAGTYTVTLTVTDNAGASNTKSNSVTVSSGGNVLQNGVAVTGLSGAANAVLSYTMVVPAGASNLKFVSSGGTGDADLYAKFGAAPTDTVYDCRSNGGTNAETCTITTAQAGTYYVRVKGYSAFSGLSLTGSYTVGGTQTQILLNPGFESGATNWTGTAGAIGNATTKTPRTGSYYAWLGGNGTTSTETVSQSIAIPAGKTAATLAFYYKIDTAETTTSTQYDKLTIAVLNSGGTVLKTCQTLSNLNKNTAYAAGANCDLSAYIGQTVSVRFSATEDSSAQTSFVLDDVALTVQ